MVGNIEKMIDETIHHEVFLECFAKGDFKKGLKILKRLYLQYYNRLENLEIKRLILHNLALAEYQMDNLEGAKKYITEIREDIEKDLKYIHLHKIDYGKLLNLYAEVFEKEITDDEYIAIQVFNMGTYEELKAIGEYEIAKSNINFKLKKYDEIVQSIQYLHNNNKDNKYDYCIKGILEELEKHSIEHHKEAFNILKIKQINERG